MEKQNDNDLALQEIGAWAVWEGAQASPRRSLALTVNVLANLICSEMLPRLGSTRGGGGAAGGRGAAGCDGCSQGMFRRFASTSNPFLQVVLPQTIISDFFTSFKSSH